MTESDKEKDGEIPNQREGVYQKVEPSYIIPPNSQSESESTSTEGPTILTTPKQTVDDNSSKSQSVRMLRLKITEDGKTKVDLRAPAGIVSVLNNPPFGPNCAEVLNYAGLADSLLSMIPNDIIESTVLKSVASIQQNGSGLILDVNEGGTRIQVWLE